MRPELDWFRSGRRKHIRIHDARRDLWNKSNGVRRGEFLNDKVSRSRLFECLIILITNG